MAFEQFLLVAILPVTVSSLVFSTPASAEPGGRSGLTDTCRSNNEAGALKCSGHNRGECVNHLSGPSSQNASHNLAARCGLDSHQVATDTTNKGPKGRHDRGKRL